MFFILQIICFARASYCDVWFWIWIKWCAKNCVTFSWSRTILLKKKDDIDKKILTCDLQIIFTSTFWLFGNYKHNNVLLQDSDHLFFTITVFKRDCIYCNILSWFRLKEVLFFLNWIDLLPPCQDLDVNCKAYVDGSCTNTNYRAYMRDRCRKHCNECNCKYKLKRNKR